MFTILIQYLEIRRWGWEPTLWTKDKCQVKKKKNWEVYFQTVLSGLQRATVLPAPGTQDSQEFRSPPPVLPFPPMNFKLVEGRGNQYIIRHSWCHRVHDSYPREQFFPRPDLQFPSQRHTLHAASSFVSHQTPLRSSSLQPQHFLLPTNMCTYYILHKLLLIIVLIY